MLTLCASNPDIFRTYSVVQQRNNRFELCKTALVTSQKQKVSFCFKNIPEYQLPTQDKIISSGETFFKPYEMWNKSNEERE